MLKLTPLIAWGPLLLAVFPLAAQDTTGATDAAPAIAKNWVFNAEADTYGSWNNGHPDTGANALRNFDLRSGEARLNAIALGVEYKTAHFGIHFDGGDGDVYQTIAATDVWKGANQYVMQGYVSYRPLAGRGLQFDFGKFYTSVGAEVVDPLANSNYSRSLAFTLGAPYYHFGLRAVVPVTKELTVGVQLIDGVNDVTGQNHGKMVGLTTAWTRPKWGWNQAMLTGSEQLGGRGAYRNLLDEVVTFSPGHSIDGYVELLYGRETHSGLSADRWYAVATSLRWKASKKLSFSPRVEYFGDPTGFNSGTAQQLREVTLTAEYKLHPLITSRFEFRRDESNRPVFDTGHGQVRRNQETLLLALLFAWKAER